jgi:hypothetical protein
MAIMALVSVVWESSPLFLVLIFSFAITISIYTFTTALTFLRSDLRGLPGPALASISNLPRLLTAWSWQTHETHIALHRRYGKLVRIGPNCVSVADPSAIPTIYGINKGYIKSNFYPTLQNFANGKAVPNMFNTTDDQLHRIFRSPVASAYSMTTLREFEHFVDSTIEAFLEQLMDRHARPNKPCNLGEWLEFYALDATGEMTFSKRLGFIDTGKDLGGIMTSVQKTLNYGTVAG